MASQAHEDDLTATTTEGFKVGEKKTIDEYTQLDQGDESLNRWKQSLGLGAGQSLGAPDDKRKAVILALTLQVEGRPDVTLDLSLPGAVEKLKSTPFTIKEGTKFRMSCRFRVQHEVLSGLKYIQVVKRKGIRVAKDEEMLGSYAPNGPQQPFYEKKFSEDEAPSGMLARGKYDSIGAFIDDDKQKHLQFEWAFEIKKNWD